MSKCVNRHEMKSVHDDHESSVKQAIAKAAQLSADDVIIFYHHYDWSFEWHRCSDWPIFFIFVVIFSAPFP